MTERVLLIGCGDLGQRVARRFLARGDEVLALRRHPPADGPQGIRWLRGDISRPDGLPALPAGVTRLIHLPAPGARDPAAYRAVFIDGLANVLDALDTSRLERVVFVSSSAVYGEHDGDWVTEDTPPSPLGANGRLLLEAEAADEAVASMSSEPRGRLRVSCPVALAHAFLPDVVSRFLEQYPLVQLDLVLLNRRVD
ncbi:MAG: NAD-dependent epimerase/dehydratase family protein, partial [Achromobacter sp.]|nr:NAD-dependent epimerase/dehydratase family protein [Achromobacter sp.]